MIFFPQRFLSEDDVVAQLSTLNEPTLATANAIEKRQNAAGPPDTRFPARVMFSTVTSFVDYVGFMLPYKTLQHVARASGRGVTESVAEATRDVSSGALEYATWSGINSLVSYYSNSATVGAMCSAAPSLRRGLGSAVATLFLGPLSSTLLRHASQGLDAAFKGAAQSLVRLRQVRDNIDTLIAEDASPAGRPRE